MSVNEKIRLIRETKGLTQEQVAEKLGVSPTVYGDIERGNSDPKLSKLEKIAEILGMKLSELLDISDKGTLNINFNKQGKHYNVYLGSSNVELEKSALLLKERDKEIENLKIQISQLQEINAMLKEKIAGNN
jgi:transcriptional regulator with XRE-family HTH domain